MEIAFGKTESVQQTEKDPELQTIGLNIHEIAANHSSVYIQWEKQMHDIDDLVNYEVRYKKSDKDKKWGSVSTEGTENNIKILDLEENTKYDFKVRAIFENDDGPFSHPPVTIFTRSKLTESKGQGFSVSDKASAPTKLIKLKSTENSICVQWTSPEQTAGSVDRYELRYKDSDPSIKRWNSKWTDNDETILTITELKENKSYDCKVRAICNDQDGPFSETIEVLTDKVILGKPSQPAIKESTDCMIMLHWTKPKSSRQDISHYEVRYRETGTTQQWKSSLTEGPENNIAIHNLHPNSVFECKVRAVYGDNDGPFSDTTTNVSTKPCPDKSVDCSTPIPTSITTNTISLRWDPFCDSTFQIDCYEIQYKQLDQNQYFSVRTVGKENYITIKNLNCNTKYEFKIRTIINSKPSSFTTPVIFQTLEEDRSAMCLSSPPYECGATAESVSLKWEAPIKSKDLINYYEILYREKRENAARVKWERMHTKTNETIITISELKPSTNYEFKIRPVFDDTVGKFSAEAITIRTQPVSNDPGLPKLKESRNNQLTVQWNPPKDTTDLIHYDLRYREPNAKKWLSVQVSNTEKTIEDLIPDRLYEFKVRAVFDEHEGQFSKTVTFSTTRLDICKESELKPGMAESKSVTENSLVITWSPPKKTKDLDEFELRYRENHTKKWSLENADRNEITLTNLKECTKYEFKVKAVYKNEEGPYSDTSILSTLQRQRGKRDRPKYQTRKPEIKFVSFDFITIKWQPPSDITDLNYYDVCHKEAAAEKWFISPVTDKTEISFVKLRSSVKYEFKVRAVFEDGQGPFSEVIVIKTKDKDRFRQMQPGKPKAVQKTSSNICVEWIVENIDTSLVNHYELNYRECNGDSQEWKIMKSNRTNETVYKLKASTLYEFKVRAIFNSCESSFSETEKVKTKSCTAAQVRQTSVTHDSMGISWELPECDSEIQGYKVAYKERNSDWEYIETTGKENRVMLYGLKDSGEYEIRIQSIFSTNDGPFSETFSDFRTQRRPPTRIPGQPKMIECTSRTITLDWSPCELENFDCYEIRYRECGVSKSTKWTAVVTEVKRHSFKVPDLKSGTDYEFKVAAVVDGEATQFGDISTKLNTKLSLATCLRQDVDTLISDGPPSRYKLPVKFTTEDVSWRTRKCQLKYEDIFKTQARQKTGLWNWVKNKTGISSKSSAIDFNERTIMLVGSTGSGKSTLIDGMINYITDVSWEDDFRFSLIDMTQDEKKHSGDETVSQTDWITTYKIPCLPCGNLDYTLNIIDTPGFGDTRGIERDKTIISQVNELLHFKNENGIQTIDGVCFVAQSNIYRLTPTQKYIFDSILSMLGKDIASNIFLLSTFADGKTPPVLDALKKANVHLNSSFKFNNSALFEPNTEQSKDKLARIFWKMGEESFKRLFDHLQTVDKKSLQLSADVLRTRNVLEVTIEGLQRQVTDGMNQLNTIRQEGEILKRYQTDIEANKNFDYEVEEVVMTEISLDQGQYVTNCLKCNFTCHFPCDIADDEGKKNCIAMAGTENCEICSQKCHWSKHRNAQFKIEAVNKKVQKTYKNLKEKYEVAQKEAKCQTAVLHKAKSQFIVLKKEVEDKLKKVKKCINDLDKTALKPNPLSDIEYIDLLIHSEESELKYGWQSRVEMLRLFRRKAEVISQAQSGNFSTFGNYDLDESLKDFAVT
ncbi:fibronectin type III domain-containing protein 3B-like isoform X2 [Mytilus galloprovincialis]